MDASDNWFCDILGLCKSWITWGSEPTNVSRDFWMPDHICRVCYDCDNQFTLFNRRHHCRLCGRVFCGGCTQNWVPSVSSETKTSTEEWDKIRVCNYCFKQWEQGLTATVNDEIQVTSLDLASSPSATSFISTKSNRTVGSSNTTIVSPSKSVDSYILNTWPSGISMHKSAEMEKTAEAAGVLSPSRTSNCPTDASESLPKPLEYCINRSDEDNHAENGDYPQGTKTGDFPSVSEYYSQIQFDDVGSNFRSNKVHPDGEATKTKSISHFSVHNSSNSQDSEGAQLVKRGEHDNADGCEASSSLYATESVEYEPVDFENNGVLWLPPEPEDEEDEKEAFLYDDDDGGGDATGEWGYLRPSNSFGSGEYRNRQKSNEEHRKVMKNVVDGHFRALVLQLLQVENLPMGEVDERDNWLEIISSLSWEAASILKPDMSKSAGMDPGGYVKIKCLASGYRYESMVVKGVVCKKNVANRRMTSKIEKPRLLILGGALEYQRVPNLLSSFETLLQQEKDHLKMAVAKIDAHKPDVLLVEKSVTRYAQEYLLEKNISVVLNVKRPLLERIARCTGGQIVPSIDHLSSLNLGYCDDFHVDKFLEEHGTAEQSGKKSVKTLMYFEGCPKPFGCTILLRGASVDELKKVKHVVQYGVFAAYHLALETSFLADEGASLPELPLNSPLTVALPDKPSTVDRSISTIPGFAVFSNGKTQESQLCEAPQRSNSVPNSSLVSQSTMLTVLNDQSSQNTSLTLDNATTAASLLSISCAPVVTNSVACDPYISHASVENKNMDLKLSTDGKPSVANSDPFIVGDCHPDNCFPLPEAVKHSFEVNESPSESNVVVENQNPFPLQQDVKNVLEEQNSLKEEFPASPSDHQSILVSLSSRCVWKGTVCERSHLFRIKYYGNFDKPLGRFLRDNLFDQSYRCGSCEMPSEAHVHCYTHRQGTLTISVKKLPEFPLPGEKEGKIWMWHRCLRCPRTNGFPPATPRIVMSDAAWGLSFGKFLELSFSNHAAASRVASCGHSLHRDCLRFYGFVNMVACFRYASIDVHSVYLPPSKLDFNFDNHYWIQRELNEVIDRAELLFSEVLNSLRQIVERRPGTGSLISSMRNHEFRRCLVDLEGMVQKEKSEFEEIIQKFTDKNSQKGQPAIDIFEINRLQRQLLFQSYMWDHRLVYAAGLDAKTFQNDLSDSTPEDMEKFLSVNENLADMNKPVTSHKSSVDCESNLLDSKLDQINNQEGRYVTCQETDLDKQGSDKCLDLRQEKESEAMFSSRTNLFDDSNSLETSSAVSRDMFFGQVSIVPSLSDTLDAAWIGENHPGIGAPTNCSDFSGARSVGEKSNLKEQAEDQSGSRTSRMLPLASTKGLDNAEDSVSWLGLPFVNFYRSLSKNIIGSAQKLGTLNEYNPVYISSFRESELQGGARLLLPVGVNDTVIPVYDDEPTSIISYALLSSDYAVQLSDGFERPKDSAESTQLHSFHSSSFLSFHSTDETLEPYRSLGSADEGILSLYASRSSLVLDPLSYTKAFHARVSFGDDGPLGKVKYTVTCYYAKRFEALRKLCCPSEIDYVKSLSRCKKWGAQGGKSNVFFAKTLDDRFIIKQVTKTELESFIKFAPEYFKYLSESIGTRSPTCLAKVLGIYQVTSKHLKGGKEIKMDVLVMENLLFGRSLTRLYDLKGSTRSRYNPDSSGSNKVLLDQNLIEAMPTSPIFVGNKAKRLLERAVWNDTAFLASIDVMDYSLLVGVDEEKHELVLGIIDFMRQYTWDKHLETWVKTSGILGGPKNASPTVISPKQYKKRFRKAMTMYFLMVPDQWSPPTIIPSRSQSDLCEETTQGATYAD
ncbi:1-phosphatidylinositol-3-phosphate 5-kinase FAB1B isoform X1 [Apium graveolens]|uniref:1-phosphatidylinositol-3-phosphate 5-kinase FAB1B isoform X1 n=1 Tax=Apium graveolens TaxID=4045 RepID=UPI003D7BDF18